MNLEDAPHHWQGRADVFWRHAMRSAYWNSEQEREHQDYCRRAALVYRGEEPIQLNHGYGESIWTVEQAMRYFERLAREVLA